jgi:hypothetical protein
MRIFVHLLPGERNIPADFIIRLVPKAPVAALNQIVILQCTDKQRLLIKENHEWYQCPRCRSDDVTLDTTRHPLETSADSWPDLRHDVRSYIQSCVTYQKMSRRYQIIRASRIVVSTLRPMQWIAMDTIGQLPELMTFKFIIVFELFPANTVCAISAAKALWKHICRFCTPLEILTDQGTQFMNQTLTHFASISIYLASSTT